MPAICATIPALSPAALVRHPSFVPARPIEKPPQYGEKPYDQLVTESFDGPVLRLSSRLRLLEEADSRHIRRGDAIDLINATQRRLEKEFRIRRPTPLQTFVTRYATFVAFYVAVAVAWCAVVALQ